MDSNLIRLPKRPLRDRGMKNIGVLEWYNGCVESDRTERAQPYPAGTAWRSSCW